MSVQEEVLMPFSLIRCVLNCVWPLLNQCWLGLLKFKLCLYEEASVAVPKQALQEL